MNLSSSFQAWQLAEKMLNNMLAGASKPVMFGHTFLVKSYIGCYSMLAEGVVLLYTSTPEHTCMIDTISIS